MNDREQTAAAMLKYVMAISPTSLVMPNVSAVEVALLVAPLIHVCPKCGAEAWCNIDCTLCNACSSFRDLIDGVQIDVPPLTGGEGSK